MNPNHLRAAIERIGIEKPSDYILVMEEVGRMEAEDLRNPKFEEAGRVHDWRNYIGERTQALWGSFTDEQRAALAEDADEMAGNEEWD